MKKSHLLLLALPYLAMAVGIICNQTVVAANGRLMPVLVPGHMTFAWANDANHVAMTASSHLKFLGDVFMSNTGVSSIGDQLMEFSGEVKIPSLVAWALLTVRDIFKR